MRRDGCARRMRRGGTAAARAVAALPHTRRVVGAAPLTRAAARPLPDGARRTGLSALQVHCGVAARCASVHRAWVANRLAPAARGRAAARVRDAAPTTRRVMGAGA